MCSLARCRRGRGGGSGLARSTSVASLWGLDFLPTAAPVPAFAMFAVPAPAAAADVNARTADCLSGLCKGLVAASRRFAAASAAGWFSPSVSSSLALRMLLILLPATSLLLLLLLLLPALRVVDSSIAEAEASDG